MCGLVGYIKKQNGEIEPEILEQMASKIQYRGPDDEGIFINKRIGLYHKRLSIIDLVTGHQPMTFDNLTIVFNGEIYNYIELRNELIREGVTFSTTSDTEVVLKMYKKYGLNAIDKLNGMFAFLLYDKPQNRLIAARDHFGIKPLYFYEDKENFLFASEIKALLAHPAVKREANYQSMHDYLTFQFVLGENTLFKNIVKVLPGHYMVINLDTMRYKSIQYWEPNFKIDHYHTEAYFIDELRRLIEDAVKIQLRSDVPLGTYLSGGMDSSLVSLIASQNITNHLKTFTGAFNEGLEFNETRYAREVASLCKAEPFEVYPTEQEFIDLLPKLIYHLDEPVAGPGLFPQYIVSRLASEHVKVVLGGQGGDEIFGGYARYVIAYLEQAIKGAIYESNEEGEHIVSLQSILPNLPYLHKYVPMMRQFMESGAFYDMDRRYFNLIDRSDSCLGLYNEDFKATHNKEEVFSRFQTIFNHSDTMSYFNKMTHFDMFGSLPGLLQVEDRVSMAVSLESRVPLLDRRIVDLVSSMPPSMKFKGAEMKYIFKRTVSDILPKTILERKDKMGFPVPLHIWAKNEASHFFRDVLLSKTCKERGIFDCAKVEKLIDSEREFGRSLWGVLSLELWFKQFID